MPTVNLSLYCAFMRSNIACGTRIGVAGGISHLSRCGRLIKLTCSSVGLHPGGGSCWPVPATTSQSKCPSSQTIRSGTSSTILALGYFLFRTSTYRENWILSPSPCSAQTQIVRSFRSRLPSHAGTSVLGCLKFLAKPHSYPFQPASQFSSNRSTRERFQSAAGKYGEILSACSVCSRASAKSPAW